MGAKFRLSPKIDVLSQRTEGRTRDKKKINKEKEQNIPDDTPVTVIPEQTMAQPTKDSEKSKVVGGKDSRPSTTKARLVPYVDLTPRRVAAVTEPVKPDQTSKTSPSYKNRAPVEVGLDVEKLVESVLDMEIRVPLRSLAGASGAIQKEIRKQVTKARLPVETNDAEALMQETETEVTIRVEDLTVSSFMTIESSQDEIPEGYLVANDPVLQYLAEHGIEKVDNLVVGKSTEPLRSIYGKINEVGQEELLLDGGSMIVSMAKKVAVQLGLTWDPSIRIRMESSTNHWVRTLGMARNTKFSIGGLTFFLQVHILEDPPYRVLLGRPFETLASTNIQTNEDGTSEVVMTDPNTKKIAVVPTYERGETPDKLQKTKFQDF